MFKYRLKKRLILEITVSAAGVFGLDRYFDERRINDEALLEKQTTIGQLRVDFFEDPFSLIMYRGLSR